MENTNARKDKKKEIRAITHPIWEKIPEEIAVSAVEVLKIELKKKKETKEILNKVRENISEKIELNFKTCCKAVFEHERQSLNKNIPSSRGAKGAKQNSPVALLAPIKLIQPLWTGAAKEITAFFIKHRMDGIEKVQKGITEIIEKNLERCCNVFAEYQKKREVEFLQKDFLGRSLIYHLGFEELFPAGDEKEAIISAPVFGKLPPAICEGVINAVKEAVDPEVVEICESDAQKALTQYRREVDYVPDRDKFLEDRLMKKRIKYLLNNFREAMKETTEEDRKKEILESIQKGKSFRRMKRGISEEEYGLIEHALFKREF